LVARDSYKTPPAQRLGGDVDESPIAGRLAFGGVVDSLVVQCGNAGFIDLHYSRSQSVIEAGSPEVLLGQVMTFKGGADVAGSIA
jgi:hypothetical protein